jgi:hypothetical protein
MEIGLGRAIRALEMLDGGRSRVMYVPALRGFYSLKRMPHPGM